MSAYVNNEWCIYKILVKLMLVVTDKGKIINENKMYIIVNKGN